MKYRSRVLRIESAARMHDKDKPITVNSMTPDGLFICASLDGNTLLTGSELALWDACVMFGTGELYSEFERLKGPENGSHTVIVDDVENCKISDYVQEYA